LNNYEMIEDNRYFQVGDGRKTPYSILLLCVTGIIFFNSWTPVTLSKEKKREGWNYSVDIFNEEEDRTTKITDSEDGEPPDTRFGKDFPAAQGTIFVDPKSGHIDVQVSKTVSNHATNDSTNDSPLAIIGAPFNLLWKSMKSIL